MSNATRYLCAAAYEDPVYTNTVIRQLITTHRGVAPSQGIDLDPIMRHCLRARKMRLIRDILFVALLVVGEYVVPFQTDLFLLICYELSFGGTPKSLAPNPNPKVEARLAHVRAAHYGNLVLYGDRNPFVGTGHNPFDELSRAKFFAGVNTGRAWSIAIELLRENSGRGGRHQRDCRHGQRLGRRLGR